MSVVLKKWGKRLLLLLVLVLLGGCQAEEAAPGEAAPEDSLLILPALEPAQLEGGEPLAVVATSSIIGDVVARVGGSAIGLTTLMQAGQDPHGYEPATNDLRLVADADVIFINGWQLEEGLLDTLETTAGDVPLVPVSAGVTPLSAGGEAEGEEPGHEGPDPHVWLDPRNVQQWAENIAAVLGQLDPAHAGLYQENAAAYREELDTLLAGMEAELEQVPAGKRRLVTNHDSLAYFADAFDFEVIGTVIPGQSTLAEPSARGLAELIGAMERAGVCTIFTESTVSDSLAETVTAELEQCEGVEVVPLYTGALGPAGSRAESYIGMMEENVALIVGGLE